MSEVLKPVRISPAMRRALRRIHDAGATGVEVTTKASNGSRVHPTYAALEARRLITIGPSLRATATEQGRLLATIVERNLP